MKQIKINYFSTIIFIIFSFNSNFVVSIPTFCDNKELLKIGIKAFCESELEISISCFKNAKKAYVQCQPGYYNEENITQQIIECSDDGQWSQPIMECIPYCIPFTNEFKLLRGNDIKFPISYVDIIRHKPVKNDTNVFPGLIVHPTRIISKVEFFKEPVYFNDFFIRLHTSSSTYQLFNISVYENVAHNNNTYKMFNIQVGSIVYSDIIAPSCLYFEIAENLSLSRKDMFVPGYKENCFVPDLKEGEEAICFKHKYISHIETISVDRRLAYQGSKSGVFQEECSESADEILVRCRLGYQNSKLEDKYTINFCTRNKWEKQTTNTGECVRVCGEIKSKVQHTTSRLYKGVEIDIMSVPWHVAIFRKNSELNSFEQICGGSIVHSNIVISAAHCFYNDTIDAKNDPSNYLVGAGKLNRNYDVHEDTEIYNEIKYIYIPSTFRQQPVRDDVSVLILQNHFEFNAHIQPICIEWLTYGEFNVAQNAWGRTVGWGSTSIDDSPSDNLLAVNLRAVSNIECKDLVDPMYRPDISNDKFCATNLDNATACRGDSGGGFVIKRGGKDFGYYFLAGIISDGLNIKNYCSSGFVTLFTNLQFQKDFIKSIIDQSRGLGPFSSHISPASNLRSYDLNENK